MEDDTACVFRLCSTAYQKTALSHSILIFVTHFVLYGNDNDLLGLGKKIKVV